MASIFAFVIMAAASGAPSPTTVTIAPGVEMPLLNCGFTSDHSAWLAGGGRGLDTGLVYGDDQQREVGRAAAASGLPRSELFITTKVPCCPMSQFSHRLTCTKARNVTADVEHDLAMLGVSYVDLLLLHWPCDRLEDTLAAYEALEPIVAQGKARAIGVSNFNASALDALLKVARVPPAVNQCAFSVAGHHSPKWGDDLETLDRCREAGITFSAWAPLGGVTGIDVLHHPLVLATAAAHNRSAAQVALRWVVQQGIVAVTSTSNPAHVAGDLGVYDFALSAEEMVALGEVGALRQALFI